eukprot:scaffold17786_cov49-Phaeocystis_antarctica.AAC.3
MARGAVSRRVPNYFLILLTPPLTSLLAVDVGLVVGEVDGRRHHVARDVAAPSVGVGSDVGDGLAQG